MASSSVLRDLAVDVINTAKNSKDAKSKIFQLEQLREIVMHRQKDLLGEFIVDIFDFMVDKAVLIRKFLVKLAGELFDQDNLITLPHLISLFNFLLSDSNDGVLTFVARELSRLYSKIVMLIVGLNSQQGIDPKTLWTSFRALVQKMNEYVSSARSEYLRSACMRLMEEQILFGIPNTSTTSDPRLARKVNDPRLKRTVQSQATTASSSSAPSVGADEIPLHHAFISRNEIQKEAEDLFTKAILWSNKGGPQGYPFSPNLMSALMQVIASVGTLRPSHGINAAKTITQLITGKGNIIQQMDKSDLENMARAANRLLVASSVLNANPEGQMQKLRTAINSLDISGQGDSEKTVGKKRGAAEVEEAEIDDMNSAERRSTIVAALEEAETNKKLMLAKAAAAADTLFQNRQGMSDGSMVKHVVTHGEFTELSGEILSLQSLAFTFNTKLVSVEESSNMDRSSVICKPVSLVDGKDYGDLAIFTLLKMFDNYVPVVEFGNKATKAYKEVLIRTVISLTISSLQDGSTGYVLPIVNSWGAEISPRAIHEIPTTVTLPRGLWLFISFCLQPTIPHSDQIQIDPIEDMYQKIELLTNFCNKFNRYAEDLKENDGDENALVDYKRHMYIYEATVLSSFARMMQIPTYRSNVKNFLLHLTKIPESCLIMLKTLVVSGNKGSSRDQHEAARYRGTRADALQIIGILVFGQDLDVANQCLQYLLWNCLNDDFELRTRVISLMVREIIPNQEWCNEEIYYFAIQSLSTAIGLEAIQAWVETHPASFDDAHEGGMEVDGEPEKDVDAINFSVSNCMSEIAFDNGGRFGGKFDQYFTGNVDANVKKAIHLFTQLCLGEVKLLIVLLEIFSAHTLYKQQQQPESNEKAAEEEKAAEATPATETPAAVSTSSKKDSDSWSILIQFKEELRVIIPAILPSHSDIQIFEVISKVNDLQAKILIAYILGLLHTDYNRPAKPALIEKVYIFAGGIVPEKPEPPAAEQSTDGTTATPATGTTSFVSNITLNEIKEEQNFRMFIPLIGGLPGAAIESALPRIIGLYSEDMEGLEGVFLRIIKARPPPMTKANLLIALHRINIEAHQLKTKTLMQAIAICLKNQSDFNSPVVKDVLQTLLQDEVPPYALMRTAILSAQTFSDIKKLVLMEIIPSLVRKAVWVTAPKLWEGVIHGAENCASSTVSSKWLEPTLKSLLGVPGPNLKQLLKSTKNVKKPMAKYFQTLREEERDEVLSGRALKQITTEEDEDLGPMMQVVEINFTDYVIDNDKKKIAKELLAMTFEEKAK